MTIKRPLTPDFNEGVDRKDLRVLGQRYLSLVEHRLLRTRLAMTPRQQLVLDVLPLLFHVNHPLLPGYVSRKTPHLIRNYEPAKNVIHQAQRLSRSFSYRSSKKKTGNIISVFLMGSTGSIAHGGESDLDIWLCYRNGLSQTLLAELAVKAERVCQWAAQMGAEMHIFLMNAADFREGRGAVEVDSEDCGTAQHFLLLDEFYRTGVWLAGAYPLWWLIPPGQESSHGQLAKLLREKRFIRSRDYIDFGGCAEIPPSEFVGAGMWQLYKGIDSPFKSFLKLKLVESYAHSPPASRPLCLDFKEAVFNDELDPDELDPYVMIYRRLEQGLSQQQQWQKLDLVRRCFYLKVGEKLSQRMRPLEKSWRRRFMEKLIREWAWDNQIIKYLDSRPQWRFDEVVREHRSIVKALTDSYRFLSAYARDQGLATAISARDIHLLGRKLYAVFQRKAGKIEMINPNIAPSLAEESLSFHHLSVMAPNDGKNGWLVYPNLANPADAGQATALKRSNSLVELVVWAHINGLLTGTTSVSLAAGRSAATLFELQHIISSIRSVLPVPMPLVTQQAYNNRARLNQILLFVNVGIDPMTEMTSRGLHKLSDHSDALGYASSRTNLVVTLDQVLINSWNEVMLQRYEAGATLVQCLNNTLASLAEVSQYGDQLPAFSVFCFCPSRAGAISKRVQHLFNRVVNCFFGSESAIAGLSDKRYLLQIAQRYFVLEIEGRRPRFISMENDAELGEYLALPLPAFSAIEVDDYALQNDPLIPVLRRLQSGVVQNYLLFTKTGQWLLVADEFGSLLRTSIPADKRVLYMQMGGLSAFLHNVLERQQMHDTLDAAQTSVADIVFFRLVNSARGYQPESFSVDVQQGYERYIDIQAVGQFDAQGEINFSLFCEHQEFSVLEYGRKVIEALARYISQKIAGAERMPCYITDLSLPPDLAQGPLHLQTTLYLKHKFQLEKRLAAARSGQH